MSFDVPADAYERFMGRWSRPLAAAFIAPFDLSSGQPVIDVGCGPGVLTDVLIATIGSAGVVAADPSESFVRATRDRCNVPTVSAYAEQLPFRDGSFQAAFAQLVVLFMADPVAGLREMARVTTPGGVVAASVWDNGVGGEGPLALFWQLAKELDPAAPNEISRAGVAPGHLRELAVAAGIVDVVDSAVTIEIEHSSFDDWWSPFTFGVGTVGSYVAGLAPPAREALRRHCQEALPAGTFTSRARAWTIVGASAS